MAKRKKTAKTAKSGAKGASKSKGSGTRAMHADSLHRSATKWDVLIHEIGRSLAEKFGKLRGRMREETYRLPASNLPVVGWMLGRGVEIVMQQGYGRGTAWKPPAEMDAATAAAIADESAVALAGLLRRYVEEGGEIFPPRPDPDLDELIVPELRNRLEQFLIAQCLPGQELHGCLADPTARDDRFFSRRAYPDDVPIVPSGDAARDIYNLGLVIQDSDGINEIKNKALWFIRHDPWLFAEYDAYVDLWMDEAEYPDESEMIRATDDFLFKPCSLDARTPVELWLERQLFLSDEQRQRVQGWSDDAFQGVIMVRWVNIGQITVLDVHANREMRISATKPEMLARLRPGMFVFTRVVRWDGQWYLSGVQELRQALPLKAAEVKAEEIHRQLMMTAAGNSRRVDPEGRRMAQSLEIQQQQHDEWIKMFGSDELAFTSNKRAEDALRRFYRHMTFEVVNPDTGKTPAQHAQEDTGKPPVLPDMTLPPDDRGDGASFSIVFHPQHGMVFIADYDEFLSAFRASEPLRPGQVGLVWEFLSESWAPYWLFERAAERFPQTFERVMRQVLRDQTFRTEELGSLLRKFKPEDVRRGVQPSVTVVDGAAATG